jgi:hypothetical protein
MKTNFFLFMALLGSVALLQGCADDPAEENIPELITKATLTFTPTTSALAGGTVVATASDPDKDGPQELTVSGPIILAKSTTYTLSIELVNELASEDDEEYNITGEVEEEADEHLFFFGWSDGLFSSPAGNGNIDNRADAVNYKDKDNKNLPLGLKTEWTTAATAQSGKTFRVVLKHQPDLKSQTSKSTDGESDLDISFSMEIR